MSWRPTTLKGEVNSHIKSGDKRPRRDRYNSPFQRGYEMARGSLEAYRSGWAGIDWSDGGSEPKSG